MGARMLTGHCLCGTVRYTIEGSPFGMYYCHCSQCRRASGSSFATNILVQAERFRLTKGEEALTAYESSPGKRRHFCSRCGSPIFNRQESAPGVLMVRCGSLDGDPGVRAQAHIYVASKSPWFEICDDLPQKREGLLSDS